MIEYGFDFRPDIILPLDFGAKKAKGKDKSKAKAWNQQRSGTSKAKLGVRDALRSKAGKQNYKR